MPKVVAGYKAQARDRIVEGARAVFQRKGFRGATMDDIAKEIGVSKGALYLYFRTKTELLVEVLNRFRSEFLSAWEGLLDEGDIAESIAHSLDMVFAGEVDPTVWHELVAEAAADPDLRSVLERDHKEDVRLMRRFLLRLEKRGRIPKMQDPATVSDIVMMLLQGTVARMMLKGQGPESRRNLVRALRLVLGL